MFFAVFCILVLFIDSLITFIKALAQTNLTYGSQQTLFAYNTPSAGALTNKLYEFCELLVFAKKVQNSRVRVCILALIKPPFSKG